MIPNNNGKKNGDLLQKVEICSKMHFRHTLRRYQDHLFDIMTICKSPKSCVLKQNLSTTNFKNILCFIKRYLTISFSWSNKETKEVV